MAENSGIEWTNHTFNPWIGCTKISPACDNCYAADWAARFEKKEVWGPKAARRRTKSWSGPKKWNREAAEKGIRPRVFCASLADVFDNHPSIDQVWRDDLWDLIASTPHLDWLLLTKRPQNIRKYLPEGWLDDDQPWPNVWFGATVENQKTAEERVPHLLAAPARIRFLSCEPLIGPIDLTAINFKNSRDYGAMWQIDALKGFWNKEHSGYGDRYGTDVDVKPPWPGKIGKLDWIITGGESGDHFRHADPDWFRALRDQCAAASTPFLFKQWEGATQKIIKALGRELDGVVHDGYPK